jgi:hydroxyacylglutathione hydrolase
MMVDLVQIPVWNDNYIYVLRNENDTVVIDPTEAGPVLDYLAKTGCTLHAILNTHHHPDHVGGNLELKEKTGCDILGPEHDADRIPGITRGVAIGAKLEVIGLSFRVLDVRAHTRGHICFALDKKIQRVFRHGHEGQEEECLRLANHPALFVGDALFLGGCGRLFEGTAGELVSAMKTFRGESPEALICCAHEYTASNLAFARHILPNHGPIARRLESLDAERGTTKSSVPDLLEFELETNPFLLALDPNHRTQIASNLGIAQDDETAVMKHLRLAKDNF